MKLLSCLALVGGILSISLTAVAQRGEDADEEGARFLVNQGLELVEQGDWSRAADRFRTALRMQPAPATRYHLARSLVELGQLNEAEEMVLGVVDAEDLPDELRASAVELAERIPSAGGRISIRVDGPDDVDVFLDDREIPRSRLRAPMTASLGIHVVEVRRGSDVLTREDVEVRQDAPSDVVLRVEASAELVLDGGAGEDGGDDTGSSLLGDWRFWAIVGGGVVAVAVIIAVIAVASSGGRVEDPIVGNFQPGVLTWE